MTGKFIIIFLSIYCFEIVFSNELLEIKEQFSARLYKELSKTEGNLIVSPLSMQALLGTALVGANGTTYQELCNGLNLPNDRQTVKNLLEILMRSFESRQSLLSMANILFFHKNIELKEDFGEVVISKLRSDLHAIDFTNSNEAASIINKWVGRKTHDKITEIVTSDEITPNALLVLINVIYFKGEWQYKFRKSLTQQLPFYKSSGEEINIDTMIVTTQFFFAKNDELNARFLKLAYKQDNMEMIIVLPNERDGLQILETEIDEVLKVTNYEKTEVNLHLPKFTIEKKIEFIPLLKKLGIKTAFETGADFSYMTDMGGNLAISDVFQKAFIKINEEGTEAVAASGAIGYFKSANSPSLVEFHANHPFLFMLRNEFGILFMGRYTGT